MTGMPTPRVSDVRERKERKLARLEYNNNKMAVIGREPVVSPPDPQATASGAGAGIGKNPSPVLFYVHQLLRAYPGGFLLGQVSSGC